MVAEAYSRLYQYLPGGKGGQCTIGYIYVYFQDEEGHEEYNESDSEDEETVLYNPKNLPLGWDGKVSFSSFQRWYEWTEPDCIFGCDLRCNFLFEDVNKCTCCGCYMNVH